jgi:hypothetical protein
MYYIIYPPYYAASLVCNLIIFPIHLDSNPPCSVQSLTYTDRTVYAVRVLYILDKNLNFYQFILRIYKNMADRGRHVLEMRYNKEVTYVP